MSTLFRRPAFYLKIFLIACVAALLSGCQSALYSQLDERQMNEMTSVLETNGIATTREQNKDGSFVLLVDESRFADALSLLSQQGMPREKYQGVGQVFTGDKLVSTTFEEKARFVYALEQELADSLTRVAGVANARVHITIPDQDPLSDKIVPSRAAVFVYYSSGVDLRPKIPILKSLVVGSVDNLSYDNVTVALFPDEGAETIASAPTAFESLPIVPVVFVSILGLLLLAPSWMQRRKQAKAGTNQEGASAVTG